MAKNSNKVRIFSALEVANICGVVNQTAINWIKSGYLKAFTTPGGQYRVYYDDLIEFLSNRNMKVPEELLHMKSGRSAFQTILVVDDDTQINDLMTQYLKRKFPDFKVVQAYDGFEAGRQISDHKPTFVILDIDLPGINGRELSRRIKNDPALNAPKVLIITGLDDPELREAMLTEGADGFLNKPMNFEELPDVIFELLKQ